MAVSDSPVIEAEGLPETGKRRGSVLIIGRGTDVAFHLDEDVPLDQLAVELDAELGGHSALFSEGGVTVNTGKRTLDKEQEDEIRRVFSEKSGLNISRFLSSADQAAEERKPEPEEPPVRRIRKDSTPLTEFSSADLARALSGLSSRGQRNRDGARVVRGTVRSGETVEYWGDLIVLGDVNPGSEVIADGDIIVMGSLKGLPHAGASGDSKAAIIALEIAAPRIRIGTCSADSPVSGNGNGPRKRKKDPEDPQPKIAYVRRGAVYVSPFAGRFARYTKGVPYEG